MFELKSYTYQFSENPGRYNDALSKMFNNYVPGINAKYNTTRYQAGDFRNYATNGNLTVLTVGNITGRPILAVDFFADSARNTGLIFYRARDLGRQN